MSYSSLMNSSSFSDLLDLTVVGTLDFSQATLVGFPVDNQTIEVSTGAIQVKEDGIEDRHIVTVSMPKVIGSILSFTDTVPGAPTFILQKLGTLFDISANNIPQIRFDSTGIIQPWKSIVPATSLLSLGSTLRKWLYLYGSNAFIDYGSIATLESTSFLTQTGSILNGTVSFLTSNEINATTSIGTNVFNASVGTISTLTSTSSNIAALTATNANITNGTISTMVGTTASIGTLSATNGTFTTGTIGSLFSTSCSATSLTCTNATITSGTISSLNCTTGSITTLTAGTASIVNGSITTLTSTSATITSATIPTLISTTATLTTGNIPTLNSTNATLTNGTVTTLTSTNATVSSTLTCPTINHSTGVTLRYDNSNRLATTSTGVNATGTLNVSSRLEVNTIASRTGYQGHLSNNGTCRLFLENRLGGTNQEVSIDATTYTFANFTNAPAARISFLDNLNSNSISFMNKDQGSEANPLQTRLFISTLGRIGIGTTSPDQMLTVNSSTPSKIGSGSWAAISDRRVKDNIQEYTKGLAHIVKVQPVSFNYTSETGFPEIECKKIQYGYVAQDVERSFPEAVMASNGLNFNDLRSMDPSVFTLALINSVRELMNLVKELQEENTNLRQRMVVVEEECGIPKVKKNRAL